MKKENCTKGPVTAKPFLTPREDDDPMMVYKVEGGDLQARYDNLPVDENGDYDQDQVDAIHTENEANAELIAEAFNVLHETGMTPRELVAMVARLRNSIRHAAHCKAPQAFPCSCDADKLWDDSFPIIAKYKPVTPEA